MLKDKLLDFLNGKKLGKKQTPTLSDRRKRTYVPEGKEWKKFLDYVRGEEITEEQLEQLAIALGDKKEISIARQVEERIQKERNYASDIRWLHPNVTSTELQICCYIVQGKSSMEISQLMGIRVSTVTSYRCRLRSKLGVKRGRSLKVYLDSITRLKKTPLIVKQLSRRREE